MRTTSLAAAVAIAVAALFLLGLVPIPGSIGPAATAPASHPASGATLPANSIPAAEFAYLTGVKHVPVAELDAMSNAGMTPAEIQGVFGAGSGLVASLARPSTGPSVGCAAVGILFGLPGYMACEMASNWGLQDGSAISNAAELAAQKGILQSVLNQVNETGAFGVTLLSTLNQTQYAMDTAADSAALSQLPNATFNANLDLAQSPVPYNLISAIYPILYSEGKIWNFLSNWEYSVYGPGGVFASGAYSLGDGTNGVGGTGSLVQNVCSGHDACTQQYYVAGGFTATLSGEPVYIEHGANFTVTGCSAATSATAADGAYSFSLSTSVPSYNTYSFLGPSDVYTAGAASCIIAGFGILPLTGSAGQAYVFGGANEPIFQGHTQVWTQGETGQTVWVGSNPAGTPTQVAGPFGSPDPYATYLHILSVPQTIANAATANARAYWTYLRDLGYTSESALPPNCAIPMPAFSLPPSLADGLTNLSFNQTFSFYMAWINSLATFFDTPPNATTFCQGHPIYHGPGGSPWADLNVNITGFVYIPGMAWASNQTLAHSSVPILAKRSTWSLNGSSPVWSNPKGVGNGNASVPIQITGWPTIAPVTLPIGKVYEVPSNDPLVIIPPAFLDQFTLTGNGSAVPVGGGTTSLVPAATTAGDALYVTSCTINGRVQANSCTLSFATINGTLPNITCSTSPGGACSNPGGGGATFGGLPNPFTWLAGLFSGLFGGGPLGSFLGGILSGLLILAVIAILVYVAITEVEAWGRGKRGGGGGGGTTVVMAGGRR